MNPFEIITLCYEIATLGYFLLLYYTLTRAPVLPVTHVAFVAPADEDVPTEIKPDPVPET